MNKRAPVRVSCGLRTPTCTELRIPPIAKAFSRDLVERIQNAMPTGGGAGVVTQATAASRPSEADFSSENGSHNNEFNENTGDVAGDQREALAAASRIHAHSKLESLFSALYPPAEEDGMRASRNERLLKGYQSVTLTYGEASPEGFSDVLAKIQDRYGGLPENDGVLYDLGCGTGKPVFAAAAVHPWRRCIGIEILSDLHGICLRALQRWEGGLRKSVTVGVNKGATAEVDFVCGDFTVLDWSDGDVVFANSTCFGDDLMNKLAQKAAALKEGAIAVTMTDPVPSPAFEVLEETVMSQAGRCATTCYIQRRVAKTLPALGPV